MSGIDDGIYRFTHGAGPVRPRPAVEWTSHEDSDRLFWLADQQERAARRTRAAAFEEETRENLEIMRVFLQGHIELGFAEIAHETEEAFNIAKRGVALRLTVLGDETRLRFLRIGGEGDPPR